MIFYGTENEEGNNFLRKSYSFKNVSNELKTKETLYIFLWSEKETFSFRFTQLK